MKNTPATIADFLRVHEENMKEIKQLTKLCRLIAKAN